VSRSNSGISVIKQQQKNEPKRTAKRSSSIQINNSIKASSILLTQQQKQQQPQLNNNKEVRRSISLKNKLDNNPTTTDSVLKHKSAFKPVASIASKQDLIKTNIEKSNKQLPFRNNSTFQTNNNNNNKKQTNSLNSNSSSSISSVSIINGITQANKTPISKLVEVTWSVSNIKKKFESNLEPTTSQQQQQQQQHYSFKLNRGLKNLDENSYVCLKGYKDSSGNSVTYI
jgi:hypothetical protein